MFRNCGAILILIALVLGGCGGGGGGSRALPTPPPSGPPEAPSVVRLAGKWEMGSVTGSAAVAYWEIHLISSSASWTLFRAIEWIYDPEAWPDDPAQRMLDYELTASPQSDVSGTWLVEGFALWVSWHDYPVNMVFDSEAMTLVGTVETLTHPLHYQGHRVDQFPWE